MHAFLCEGATAFTGGLGFICRPPPCGNGSDGDMGALPSRLLPCGDVQFEIGMCVNEGAARLLTRLRARCASERDARVEDFEEYAHFLVLCVSPSSMWSSRPSDECAGNDNVEYTWCDDCGECSRTYGHMGGMHTEARLALACALAALTRQGSGGYDRMSKLLERMLHVGPAVGGVCGWFPPSVMVYDSLFWRCVLTLSRLYGHLEIISAKLEDAPGCDIGGKVVSFAMHGEALARLAASYCEHVVARARDIAAGRLMGALYVHASVCVVLWRWFLIEARYKIRVREHEPVRAYMELVQTVRHVYNTEAYTRSVRGARFALCISEPRIVGDDAPWGEFERETVRCSFLADQYMCTLSRRSVCEIDCKEAWEGGVSLDMARMFEVAARQSGISIPSALPEISLDKLVASPLYWIWKI